MYFAQTLPTGPVPGAESLKLLDAYFVARYARGEAAVK